MATIKITKKDNYNALLALIAEVKPANATQLTEFIEHEIELIERKAEKASGTASKTAKANAVHMDNILAELAQLDNAVTITEFMEIVGGKFIGDNGKPFSNQKFSALFTQLVNAGKVERVIIKKKSYFSLVKDIEVEDTDTEVEGTEDTDEE